MVHALQLQPFAVEQEDVALYLHAAEAQPLLDAAALCLVIYVIEGGGLRVPFRHLQRLEADLGPSVFHHGLRAALQAVAGEGEAHGASLAAAGGEGQTVKPVFPPGFRVNVPEILGL